jgi:drug/metabolite transporter (DMT)-like permease
VKFLHLPWESRRLLAVLLATLGVMVVVYGGSSQAGSSESQGVAKISTKPSAPLVGDLLTLGASVGYGLYQVLYKKYAALPSDPELVSEESYHPIRDDYTEISSGEASLAESVKADIVYPPPFGLHPNLLASFVGLLTITLLWIPLPLLHYSGIERFELPSNLTTTVAIAGIAASGIVFNAGFLASAR